MNKQHWNSIYLDDDVSDDILIGMRQQGGI